MRMTVNISPDDILKAIKKMNYNELEMVKNALIARSIYLKKYKKDNIDQVICDFRDEGYSQGFLDDLEEGLKKSSVYNEN